MSRDFELRIEDILEACHRVADYIAGYDLARFWEALNKSHEGR